MPFYDNLYSSLGDSDDDDYADLSPSDGYFASSSSHTAPSIPNVMVSDPTLERQEQQEANEAAEAKAQEAIDERVALERSRIPGNHNPLALANDTPAGASSSQHPATSTPAFLGGQDTSSMDPSHNLHTYSQTSPSIRPHPHPSLPSLPFPFVARQRPASLYSDAPPAYTPSPTSPPSSTTNDTRDQTRDYNTFNSSRATSIIASTDTDTPIIINMGNPDAERERLLPRGPESMLAPVGGPASGNSWLRRFVPSWLNLKTALMILLLLGVTVGFLVTPLKAGIDKKKTPGHGGDLGNEDGGHQKPHPVEGAPPFVPKFCHNAKFLTTGYSVGLDFKGIKSVSFQQKYHEAPGSEHVHVGGDLIVRRSPDVSSSRIEFDVATNDKSVEIDISLLRPDHKVTVSVPERMYPSIPDQTPCVEIKGTIWIPEGAIIDTLDVTVVQLDVSLLNDLSIHAQGSIEITTISGDVVSGSSATSSYSTEFETYSLGEFSAARISNELDSRVIRISTLSGDVRGHWPLYDELSIHTTSGDIKTSVTPKDELESDPKPALLKVGTTSGAINIQESISSEEERDSIPHRDYQVDIHSTSSKVSGALAFSSKASFQSISGAIDLDLLPILDRDTFTPHAPAHLTTETTSSKTGIRLLEPVWYGSSSSSSTSPQPGDDWWQDVDTTPYRPVGDEDPYKIIITPNDDEKHTTSSPHTRRSGKDTSTTTPLNCLESKHHTASGNLQLQYPDSWVGKLSAETTNGKLKVRGRDVYIMKSSGWIGRKIEAGKGPRDNVESGSTIEASPSFGNLDILIGGE